MKRTCVFGYDPVFLDILVTPKDKKGNTLHDLPKLGEHVPNTDIKLVAGGNALNVAKVMSKLGQGHEVMLVANMNSFFMSLIRKVIKQIQLYATTDQEPNYTCALHLRDGEWQMNAIKHGFAQEHLTPTAFVLLALSSVIPFSNFGLNQLAAPRLYSRMIRFLNGYTKLFESKTIYERIKPSITELIKKHTLNHSSYNTKEDETFQRYLGILVKTIKEKKLGDKLFYLDPSTLADFKKWKWLQQFIQKELSTLKGYKLISLNEHEYELMVKHDVPLYKATQQEESKIIVLQHDTKSVKIWKQGIPQDEPLIVEVPPLDPNKIVTTVGAGDSWNAGLLSSFLESKDIIKSTETANQVAQQYLTGKI